MSAAFKQCLHHFNWINHNTKYLKIKKDYFCESLRRKHHLIPSVGFLLPLDTLADLFIYNVKHQKNKQEPKCSLGKLDKILLVASIFLLCYMRCGSNKSWIISYGSSETVGYGRIMALTSCRDKWFRFYWGFPGHPSVKLADFERMSKLSLRDFFFFQILSFQATLHSLLWNLCNSSHSPFHLCLLDWHWLQDLTWGFQKPMILSLKVQNALCKKFTFSALNFSSSLLL